MNADGNRRGRDMSDGRDEIGQPKKLAPADKSVGRAAITKGQRVTRQRPYQSQNCHRAQRHHQGIERVAGAHQTAIKEGQTRRHHQHQNRGDDDPGGVAGIEFEGLRIGNHGGNDRRGTRRSFLRLQRRAPQQGAAHHQGDNQQMQTGKVRRKKFHRGICSQGASNQKGFRARTANEN